MQSCFCSGFDKVVFQTFKGKYLQKNKNTCDNPPTKKQNHQNLQHPSSMKKKRCQAIKSFKHLPSLTIVFLFLDYFLMQPSNTKKNIKMTRRLRLLGTSCAQKPWKALKTTHLFMVDIHTFPASGLERNKYGWIWMVDFLGIL